MSDWIIEIIILIRSFSRLFNNNNNYYQMNFEVKIKMNASFAA